MYAARPPTIERRLPFDVDLDEMKIRDAPGTKREQPERRIALPGMDGEVPDGVSIARKETAEVLEMGAV